MRGIWLLAAVVFMLTQFGISLAQDQAKPKKLNPYTGNLKAIEKGRILPSFRRCSNGTPKRPGERCFLTNRDPSEP